MPDPWEPGPGKNYSLELMSQARIARGTWAVPGLRSLLSRASQHIPPPPTTSTVEVSGHDIASQFRALRSSSPLQRGPKGGIQSIPPPQGSIPPPKGGIQSIPYLTLGLCIACRSTPPPFLLGNAYARLNKSHIKCVHATL